MIDYFLRYYYLKLMKSNLALNHVWLGTNCKLPFVVCCGMLCIKSKSRKTGHKYEENIY